MRTWAGRRRPRMQIAPHGGRAERRAREVSRRAAATPPGSGPLVSAPGPDGIRALSPEGRTRFGAAIGAPVDHARIHVDQPAERLARLARANAVTYGRDVFIPPQRFALGTAQGRRLLGHELAHVAQAPAMPNTVFRDGTPHYPSRSERAHIEDILGRHAAPLMPAPTPSTGATSASDASPTPAAQPKVKDPRRSLSEDQVKTMAGDLKEPFTDALNRYFRTTGPIDIKVKDLAQAFSSATKALKAIRARFGSYLEHDITLTADPTLSKEKRLATHQVLVIRRAPDADTFIDGILSNYCPACKTALKAITPASRDAVLKEFTRRLHADKTLAAAEATATLFAVGGEEFPGANIVNISPYTDDASGDAIHELLHAFTHPAFRAAYGRRDIREGFTEYFTQEIKARTGRYGDQVKMVTDVRDRLRTPWGLDSAEESLRLAFFRGRVDLIAWGPLTDAQRKQVSAAEGRTWAPDRADTAEKDRLRRARRIQQPHTNIVGPALLFQRHGGGEVELRYARVVKNSEFARRRLFLEGQLGGSPIRLGGSLGLGVEFQEPWLYAAGGLRVVGSGALSGLLEGRVDLSPFLSSGVRLWHKIRVGGEAFALIPVAGTSRAKSYGGGITLGREF